MVLKGNLRRWRKTAGLLSCMGALGLSSACGDLPAQTGGGTQPPVGRQATLASSVPTSAPTKALIAGPTRQSTGTPTAGRIVTPIATGAGTPVASLTVRATSSGKDVPRFESRGLGLTRARWEVLYGKPNSKSPEGWLVYSVPKDGKYTVNFIEGLAIQVLFEPGQPFASLDKARSAIDPLLPRDFRLINTIDDTESFSERYGSKSLCIQLNGGQPIGEGLPEGVEEDDLFGKYGCPFSVEYFRRGKSQISTVYMEVFVGG